MITKLSKLIEEKNMELHDISKRIIDGESEKVQLELFIRDVQRSITKEKESLEMKEKSFSQLILDNQALQSEADVYVTDLVKYSKRLALLSPAMEKISLRLRSISEEPSSKNKLAEKNISRTHIVKSLDLANIELGHTLSILRGLEAKLELDMQHLAEMDQEYERLSLELKESKLQIQDIYKKSQSLEDSIDINQIREFYNVFCGQIISKGLNDFEDKDITISPDKVQIMTYHQSKGLEFPFVIMLNLRNQPRISICHELESLFEPYRDKKRKTLSKQIKAIQDQIRLYYVGQSRAKYGLIFADTNISEWDYSLGYDWEGAYRNDMEWLEKRGVNLD